MTWREPEKKSVSWGYALLVAVAVLLLGSASWIRPRLLYNPSESMPKGFYIIFPADEFAKKDNVALPVPEAFRKMLADRRYLPPDIPLLKQIIGVEGDQVCVKNRKVFLDGTLIATRLRVDGAGRSLPVWTGCHRLLPEEFFLLGPSSDLSFDSRYFGPVKKKDISGKAVLVWPAQQSETLP